MDSEKQSDRRATSKSRGIGGIYVLSPIIKEICSVKVGVTERPLAIRALAIQSCSPIELMIAFAARCDPWVVGSLFTFEWEVHRALTRCGTYLYGEGFSTTSDIAEYVVERTARRLQIGIVERCRVMPIKRVRKKALQYAGGINSPPQILQQPEEEDNLDLLKTAVRLYKGLS